MCGIAGFVDESGASHDDWPEQARRMAAAIKHRGPDDEGVWIDATAGVALAHRRLSVLDLSSSGHQPMASSRGRYLIVFNGEIYNHLELRAELNGPWRGYSDTETLLAGFECWGTKRTLEKAAGMFALAVWDHECRRLTLACDRIGEKPLYYGWQGAIFLFGSELRALKAHPAFSAEIDRGALSLLFRHKYIAAPHSIYSSITKLLPGSFVEIVPGTRTVPTPRPYWSTWQAVEEGLAHPFTGNDREAVDALEQQLRAAVRRQMLSDVPLGAFLSGGIDSSTVVALMQTQSSRPIKTFAIGFHEEAYDEAHHAKAVARHLGTEHTELYVSPTQAMEVIPRLPNLYDEPFADSSQIPSYLLSALARQQVTVSLSGDGGDELFCGYDRYFDVSRAAMLMSRMPTALSVALKHSMCSISPSAWDRLLAPMTFAAPRLFRRGNAGDRLHKLAHMLDDDRTTLYQRFVSSWSEPMAVVVGAEEPATILTGSQSPAGATFVETLMAKDMVSYLPGDILVKVDRAAMALSLETRMPFLDPDVMKLAWRLSLATKVRNGKGKWILRQILHRYVPMELNQRPKRGFSIPISEWLRKPLRDWAEALLDESCMRQEGYLNPIPIQQKWREHLSGARNWAAQLWIVLMFQSWLHEQRRHAQLS